MYTYRDGKIYYKSDFNTLIGADGEIEVDQVMGERVTPLNALYLFKKLTGISEATDDATTLTSKEARILTSYPWEITPDGWREDSISTGVTTITAETSGTIDALDALGTLGSSIRTELDTAATVTRYPSLDKYREMEEELACYKERYHSWFSDKELDKETFKTLPSDIAKETMQIFCVEVVSGLVKNLFKEETLVQTGLKTYVVAKLGECKATYDIVHAAIDRFKLDRKVLKQLLNKTIAKSKERFLPRTGAMAGMFFETTIDWDHIEGVSLEFTFDLKDDNVLYIKREGTDLINSWEA